MKIYKIQNKNKNRGNNEITSYIILMYSSKLISYQSIYEFVLRINFNIILKCKEIDNCNLAYIVEKEQLS